jgi:hypothetical protein
MNPLQLVLHVMDKVRRVTGVMYCYHPVLTMQYYSQTQLVTLLLAQAQSNVEYLHHLF